jgi:peptidoglycan/xylan/chitin deacetylase (PgdA/CDA1 family)
MGTGPDAIGRGRQPGVSLPSQRPKEVTPRGLKVKTRSFVMARGIAPALVLVALSLSFGATRSGPPPPSVALTFDDLPAAQTKDPVEAGLITRNILGVLNRHHAPAIGFVIGKRVEGIGKTRGTELLRAWVQHGFDLGNHTYSHPDLDSISPDQFAQEVVSNEAFFVPLLPRAKRSPLYLRFPYNHTGDT